MIMINKIFKNTMVTVAITLLLSSFFAFGIFQKSLNDQLKTELKQIAQLIAVGYQTGDTKYLDELPLAQRVSIIDQKGTVIYDSIKDATNFENHLQREEVQEALSNGEGLAKRYSQSLHQNYIYYALTMDDGLIVRVAQQQSLKSSLLSSLSIQLVLAVVILLIVAYILSKRLTKRIIEPINTIDIDQPFLVPTYQELNPLLTRLDQQNTTIKQQMDQLKRYDKEFNALISGMNEGMVVINHESKILSYNPAALKLFDVKELSEGQSVYQLNGSLPFVQLIQSLEQGKGGYCELSINHRFIRLLVSPVKDKGEVNGAILLALDISDRKNQELLRAQFSANVSHELKTPLTSIIGFSEILANGLVNSEDVTTIGKDIYDQSKRLLKMVEDIIHLSKLDEANQATFTSQEVLLKPLADEIIANYLDMAKKSNIELIGPNDNAIIVGNIRLVKECIANLVENAIKYGKTNGHVWITVDQDDKYVYLKVKDDGVGIKESDISRIFERFYRVDQSRNQTIKGSGLGLSIVKHAMDFHHGNVSVESTLYKGTTFTLTFPR